MHDPELDGKVAINPNNINSVLQASIQDKKQRSEVDCLIISLGGQFATDEKFESIIERIETILQDV